MQFPALDGPTPNPSGPVTAGDTAVRVMATFPAVATENVKTTDPFGPRLPLNVSVELLGEGDDLSPNKSLSGLLQADMINTETEIRSERNGRATFILLLSAAPR